MTIDSIAKNMMSTAMMKVASGNRINSARDDAAGLAMREVMDTQIRGLRQGTDNTADMRNLVTTAEGGMNTISDSLQRIRELSIQASNGTLTQDDRAIIQQEVGQLIDNINQAARTVEYNGQALLDGTFTNKQTASSANGEGLNFSISDMSLSGYLSGYDVSSASFDIGRIDEALNAVGTYRAELGAIANRFDYVTASNDITMLNMADAKSRISDMDMAKGMMDVSRDKVLSQTQIYMQMMRQNVIKQNSISIGM